MIIEVFVKQKFYLYVTYIKPLQSIRISTVIFFKNYNFEKYEYNKNSVQLPKKQIGG